MSATDVDHEVTQVAVRLSLLLTEYTTKLRDLSILVREVQDRYARAMEPREIERAEADFKAIRFRFLRLSTAAADLARQASQMVEHSNVEIVARLELSLRAAEFEAALQEAQQRINAGPEG